MTNNGKIMMIIRTLN